MYSNQFDDKAKEWDNNPKHFQRSEAIAKKIAEMVPLNQKMIALEYGAGTGILSNILRNQFKQITLMDHSSEMIKMIEEKIRNFNIDNFIPLCFDLEHDEYNNGTFDVVLNQMVMHHVKDIPLILKKFYELTKPGGFLAIADLYSEDGSFHGPGVDVHLGFDPQKLSKLVKSAGYRETTYEPCYTLKKEFEDGSTKDFPIFLLTARK